MNNRKTTIHDIAKELNVSASTVSRALKDHPRISDATKKSVIKTAKNLNYQPNNIAAALSKGQTNTIGVIVPTADRNFFSSIIRGVEEVANNAGYKVVICQSYDSYEKEKLNIKALLEARVDGILASIAFGTRQYDHYKDVVSQGIPIIFYDRAQVSVEASSVEIDDHRGAYLAVKHLIEQGCKRIAHFAGQQHVKIYQERLRGYKDALEDYGTPLLDEELVLEFDLLNLDSGKQGAEQLLAMDALPDAIFSASDYAAMGAMQKLKTESISIPDDVAIVGFSNEKFTSLVKPSLSTVDQHTHTMGESAARLFLDQTKDDNSETVLQRKVLQPTLIIRESSIKNSV